MAKKPKWTKWIVVYNNKLGEITEKIYLVKYGALIIIPGEVLYFRWYNLDRKFRRLD